MKTEIIIIIAVTLIATFVLIDIWKKLYRAFIVPEGYVGLLYHHGRFIEQLAPGRHVRWGRNFTIDAEDMRKTFLFVPGQDVLTSDNINVKLSILVTYQVADAIKARHETQNWRGDLHNAAQLALRAVVGGVSAETLLTQRFDLALQVLPRVQAEGLKIGLTVQALEVKDVMLPAEIKRAFADVLKARQEGQAALERARGESAALRNLANAARLLEGNPSLMNLRVLQSLATASNSGNTLVLGMPAGFVPLKNGATRRSQNEPPQPEES